jgi:hypothetical protein
MVKVFQHASDRLLNLVVPRVTGHATTVTRTCVSCPGAAGYLFRYKFVAGQCGGLATECTWYGPCGRTCR